MELDPDWIPNKNLPSESQIEKNSSSKDPRHRQRTKRKSKDNSARGQANKKRQIDGAVSQSTQNPAWDRNEAESEKEQDIHLTDAKDEEDLNPKLEGFKVKVQVGAQQLKLTHIKKESLLCEYPKCAEVKKELFKDLQNALLVEKQLRAMIKYLESISNVNLDLLQVCLDMHHDPAVEAEFKKVIDMVQTIMNLEMWELKAQKRAKTTTSDPPLKTVASMSHKNTSSTSTDLRDNTDDINHCNDNNTDNHSPSTEITHFKNNHTFTSQINSDAATETKDNTTSISNAETISNINANTTTNLKDANTTTEMSELINANTSSPSHVNISSPIIKTRMSAINDDDITSLITHNYPKQQGLPKALKIFLVSPSGPNNFTHTLVSKSTSTIPTSVRRSEGANLKSNLSGVPDYDGCIGICNKFVNIVPSSASCPTQICGRTRVLCEICGKLIACSKYSAEAFKLHMKRLHSGERPHKCDQCGKRFVCKRHLTYHLHLHSGERLYQCEDCGKSFKSKSNLQQHQMIHDNGAKMHKCSLCDYKCRWPGNLKMHIKNRHSISVSSDSTNAIPLQEEWKELAQ